MNNLRSNRLDEGMTGAVKDEGSEEGKELEAKG